MKFGPPFSLTRMENKKGLQIVDEFCMWFANAFLLYCIAVPYRLWNHKIHVSVSPQSC